MCDVNFSGYGQNGSSICNVPEVYDVRSKNTSAMEGALVGSLHLPLVVQEN